MSNSKSKNENEICMLCGEWKEKDSLVCRECFSEWWERETIEENPLIKWTLEKGKICLDLIGTELEKARSTLNTFKTSIKKKAYDSLKKALMGVKIPQGEFSSMLEEKQQKFWEEGEGDKLYGHLKRTEYRDENLPGFVKGLQTKIDDYEKQQKQEQEKQ